MSKVRKRRNNKLEEESLKSVKKLKKTPDKENDGIDLGSKTSENDFGIPKPDSTLCEEKTPKRKISSPKKPAKPRKKLVNSVTKYGADEIKSLNISQLLDLGEDKNCETPITNDSDGTSDSDEGDWEEVRVEEKSDFKNPVIPKEGVSITVEVPGLNALKRKKKGFDLEAHIKRQMNQVKRELQLLIHKVHVLCWIAHLKFVNTVLNSDTLMGISLSLVSNKNLYPPKYADLGYLERIVKWFHSVIELKEFLKNPLKNEDLSEQLSYQYGIKTAYNKKYFVLMMIVLFRTLGLKTRLVMSFQVIHIRPTNLELSGKCKQGDEVGKKTEEVMIKDSGSKLAEGEMKIVKVENSYFSGKSSEPLNSEKKEQKSDDKSSNSKKSLSKTVKKDECKIKSGKGRGEGRKRVVKKGQNISEDSDSDDSLCSKHFKCSTDNSKKSKSESGVGGKLEKGKRAIGETPKMKGKSDFGKIASGKVKQEGTKKQCNVKGKLKKSNMTPEMRNKIIEKASQSSDTDSDFVPESLKKKTGEKKIDRRVFSSDDEEETIKKKGLDVWAEVFLEAEEKWISVDPVRQKIHCINELYSRATQPVSYIVACNNDSTLKDVTKRYVPNWHSDTRKRRVDEAWWNETLWPYLGPKTAQDKEEDEDINKQLLDKPLPAVISEYKDHPLYALKRHLLKFEGIYPPDAPTLGFIRGEPVYARECVVTLRSREIWYKEARVVRLKEEPYKIVKARPKFDKMSGEIKKDLPLELFGFWQTEEYIPPIATEGKVPRNEYGNVDLFKPCMLPKGTVHLQIQGLNKIAKKLGIDCAAAVIGFEFHSGASHPITDGFVVCEEFKDVLLDAWNKEIDESSKKNEEKRLKRIYTNWKRLIRGLLIREKLKIKYDFGGESSTNSKPEKIIKKKSETKIN